MFQRVIGVAAWACLAFIAFVTLSSLPMRPELSSRETDIILFVERFGAYGLLGFLFRLAYPRRIAFVCVLVLGSAVFLELLQLVVPDRDARILDALEKLAGGATGILTANILAFYARRHWKM
jgi:VanZ family protein